MRYTSSIVCLVERMCAGDKVDIALAWEKVRSVTKLVPIGIDSTRGEAMGEFMTEKEESQMDSDLRLKLSGLMEQGADLWMKAESALKSDPQAALSYIVTAKEITISYLTMLPKDGWQFARENGEAILAEADKQIELLSKQAS